MTSNAYIATDGEKVMKVGKANDVKRREKQIAIPIKYAIACLDEEVAFRVESQMRDFVIKKGGIRHQKAVDWFRFDPQIYAMLCEFVTGIDGQKLPEKAPRKVAPKEVVAPPQEMDLDTEIHMLVMRYHKLLRDEMRLKLQEAEQKIQRLRETLENERKRADEEINAIRQKMYEEINAQHRQMYEEVNNKRQQMREELNAEYQQLFVQAPNGYVLVSPLVEQLITEATVWRVKCEFLEEKLIKKGVSREEIEKYVKTARGVSTRAGHE